jgi:hypothetical protein
MIDANGCARPRAVSGLPPPRPKCKKWPVLKIDTNDGLVLQIVNSLAYETYSHFLDHTVGCTDPTGENCWLDHTSVGKPRYYLWLAVVREGKDLVELARLTMCAVDYERRLHDPGLNLRALELEAWRVWCHDHTEMQARLYFDRAKRTDLPREIDLPEAVQRMLTAPKRAAQVGDPRLTPMQRVAARFGLPKPNGR